MFIIYIFTLGTQIKIDSIAYDKKLFGFCSKRGGNYQNFFSIDILVLNIVRMLFEDLF